MGSCQKNETLLHGVQGFAMGNEKNAASAGPLTRAEEDVEDVTMVTEDFALTSEIEPSRCDKYNLRRSSLRVRAQVQEKHQQTRQKKSKSKSRPPPLSKYRRRSANARERFRMAEINEAYEDLKQVLPQDRLEADISAVGGINGDGFQNNGKPGKNQPTKIMVLRLAINYIAALRDILGYNGSNGSGYRSADSNSSGDGDDTSSRGSTVHENARIPKEDLGSDAASTSSSTAGSSSGSGDEESLLSSDLDTGGVDDFDFFASTLAAATADFSPDLSPDFTATLRPEEALCLELMSSVL